MQGLLELFQLYVWDYCLVEMSVVSPDLVSWLMRLNSPLLSLGTSLHSCLLRGCVMAQHHLQRSCPVSWCSHHCASLWIWWFSWYHITNHNPFFLQNWQAELLLNSHISSETPSCCTVNVCISLENKSLYNSWHRCSFCPSALHILPFFML